MRLSKLGEIAAVAAIIMFATWTLLPAGSEPAVAIGPPKLDAAAPAGSGLETAVLAGGCFWGVQAVFQHTKGVKNAVSGYAGGAAASASYKTVSAGTSAHAEAVQITFDPREVSYGQILQIYFSVAHNPTELNRQGPDSGPQYRSEIFPQSEEQAKIARAYIVQLDAAKAFSRPIATKVGGTKAAFYRAEAYHQDYAVRNPGAPYIRVHDAPKVESLKRLFPALWREAPVTVAMAEKSGG